jgi:hypothetical protein
MKRLLVITLLSSVLMREVVAQNCAVTNAPAKIELSDQFEVKQSLVFPTTNLTFLVIADKTGSEQIAGWVSPVEGRFGAAVAILGIADVSAVPRPLRGMVRRKFQKAQSHSVMLDWSGETVKQFAIAPNQANVLLVDCRGNILKRLTGKATDKAVNELCETIEQNLAAGQR